MDASSFDPPPHSPYFDLSNAVLQEGPIQAHLMAALGDAEYHWGSHTHTHTHPHPHPSNQLQSWWNKITGRRQDKVKARGRAETPVTAPTSSVSSSYANSPLASMDNSAHSNPNPPNRAAQPDARLLLDEAIGVHLQPRPRRHSQEDLCNFLNLLALNYHDQQHHSDPLVLITANDEQPQAVVSSLHKYDYHYNNGTNNNNNYDNNNDNNNNNNKMGQHSLRRVQNQYDLTLTANGSEDKRRTCERMNPASQFDATTTTRLNHPIQKMSCSPAVPFPNTNKENPSNTDDEYDPIAMAEYMYTRATWRMYDRIMAARIKAEEAKRKSTSYHSLPPVGGIDYYSYPHHHHHPKSSCIEPPMLHTLQKKPMTDASNMNVAATENDPESTATTKMMAMTNPGDHFHEPVVFCLELDS